MAHRMIADTDSAEPGQRDTSRKVLLSSGLGDGEVFTLSAERDESLFSPPIDDALAPFNDVALQFEGRLVRRLSLEKTLRYIPIVEQRAALSARLLVQYPEELDALDTVIKDAETKVDVAQARVTQVVLDERAWLERQHGQLKPGGLIITSAITIAPEVWLSSRQCLLQDTLEWKRLDFQRSQRPIAAIDERTRKRKLLAAERIDSNRFASRLYELRANVEWWQRELGMLAV